MRPDTLSAYSRVECSLLRMRTVKVYVTIPGEEAAKLPASADIGFIVRDTGDGTETKRSTNFRGPGQ